MPHRQPANQVLENIAVCKVTPFCLLYVTCADAAEARRIGGALLDARLAACVNILPEMQAIYDWDGARQETTEVPMLIKTSATARDAAMAEIAHRHSYAMPAIIEIATDAVAGPYGAWIAAATT